MAGSTPLAAPSSNAMLEGAVRMEKLQPVHAVLLGVLIVGLAVFLFSSGYGIGRDIAAREQAAVADVR